MKKFATPESAAKQKSKFGGRATAVGVSYEAQIAAYIAAKMLGGYGSIVFDGISGNDVSSITMQDAEPVDDVVVTLHGDLKPKIFISAKHRKGAIAMTAKSPAFTDVVDTFVQQFLQLAMPHREESRLMWAVTSSAGAGMTQGLRNVLDTFRADASASLSDFLRRRPTREREAMNALLAQTKRAWKTHAEKMPTESELCEFLRTVYVAVFDFDVGLHHEQTAEETIRGAVATKAIQSRQIWEKLELHFNQADRRGLRTTEASLRKILAASGFTLKATPTFAEDIALLNRLTTLNFDRLRDHTLLRFTTAEIHIERTEELSALLAAAKQRHILITGEPGCGKSGLVYPLANALMREKIPVVLLLAEEIFGRDWKGAANLPGLSHALDEVLANWPNGEKGVLITDALDAVRDVETQQMLRRLLQDVQRGLSGWMVVASVREFDLRYGHKLRESFPGDGVSGYSSTEFTGVSHFHVTGLPEAKLDELMAKAPETGPFIVSARKNLRSGNIHRSPFFLRLASELLRDAVLPSRLADWNSPAILLRKFWNIRVIDGSAASNRKVALQLICGRMAQLRRMVLAVQEVSLNASELDAVNELRSRGIIQSPVLRYGSPAGEDELRFSHHLLHDYAIARSTIPAVASRFADFAAGNPLLPIFYRQSFLFALEELWDGPEGREGFWRSALQMESIAQLHGVTRILAPILAARRVGVSTDLTPLFAAVKVATSEDSPAERALRHMAAGLQDANDDSIRTSARAWCSFIADLASLLSDRPSLETPVVHIIARLNAVSGSFEKGNLLNLNMAARKVLAHHVSKEVSKGWRHAAYTAIETLCKTFPLASESKNALLSLLTPERLAYFPHWDLFDLAHHLKFIPSHADADAVVLSLFEAAFSTEPESDKWEDFGGHIMPLRMQSRDNWLSIRYALAEYYKSLPLANTALMTDIACISQNTTAHRLRHNSAENVIVRMNFRGAECEVFADFGHIWGRGNDESAQILSHFESLVEELAAAGNEEHLGVALDHFAVRNRSSIMWMVFMEAGAKHPAILGWQLKSILTEPVFLTHPDYSYGGILLFTALHKSGNCSERAKLEQLILDLPNVTHHSDEPREPMPSWVEHAQNKLLGALNEINIAQPVIRTMRQERAKQGPFPKNRAPEGIQVNSYTYSDEELIERRGISLKDATNAKLFRLREALKVFREDENNITVCKIDANWAIVGQCERAVQRNRKNNKKMAEELWGYLVASCTTITQIATWPSTSERWKTIRRILLKAAAEPPSNASESEDAKEDQWPVWGWPSPRIDAARGLLLLVYRLGTADKAISTALLKLSRDRSHALRFNMGSRLAVLERDEPELMWQLIDKFVRYEKAFSVLEMVVTSLDSLWMRSPDKVKQRLSRITTRAIRSAPDENHIHETLAHVHLFRFLRTGDKDCEEVVNDMISECDKKRSSHSLLRQLHSCRSGGWLSAGDAVKVTETDEAVRTRTWKFFRKLLITAQMKVRYHREVLQKLHADGQPNIEAVESIRKSLHHSFQLVDGIAMQLYFASGAYAERQKKDVDLLSRPQMQRFWRESGELFRSLAEEIHPHTAHQIVDALHHLLPCEPRDVFLIAMTSITSSSTVGYQHESLAVAGVVQLIQRAFADHHDIFQTQDGKESECLTALLKVLDLFVEAGWREARQLTHRLEEIYR